MPKASPIQTSFNAGKLSERLEGRIDLAKYANGCRVLQNFLPQIQGSAEKRPGTRYVNDANQGPNAPGSAFSHVRLVPFEFSTDDAYILEFTHQSIRVYRNGGRILASPISFLATEIDDVLDQINLGTGRHYLAHEHGPYQITTTDTLPSGLALLTDYFIVNNEERTLTFVDTDVTPGDDTIKVTGTNDFFPVNVNIGTDVISIADHGYSDGFGPVQLTVDIPSLPAGLLIDTDYYIIRLSDTDFQLSLQRRGSPVDITTAGSVGSTFTIHDDHRYAAGFEDGPVRLTTTGTLPAGLALATDYWVNRTTPSLLTLSLTRGGPVRDITAAAGGGTHTMTPRNPNDAFRFQLAATRGGVSIAITQGIGTHTLTPQSGLPFQIFSPYEGARHPEDQPTHEIFELQFTQSADVMFFAHKDHAPMKLSRTGHDQWTLEEIFFDFPPFLDENIDNNINLYVSVATGNMTIFAEDGTGNKLDGAGSTTAFFTANDVGRVVRIGGDPAIRNRLWDETITDVAADEQMHFAGNLYKVTNAAASPTGVNPPVHTVRGQNELDRVIPSQALAWTFLHRGAAWATITGFVDGGEVNATVIQLGFDIEFASTVVNAAAPSATKKVESTPNWALGAWDSVVQGYPRTVTFFEDRLWWAATPAQPQTLWASRTGDFQNHETSDEDESGLVFTLNTDQVNVIEWLSPGQRLAIGTAGGEFVASGATLDEALTPTNLRIVRHSTLGSRAGVMPLRIEQIVLFVSRSGGRIRELVFDFDTDSFVAPDLSVLADDLFLQEVATTPTAVLSDKAGAPRTMAFQQEPNRTVWVALDSGDLLSMTYDRAQDVVGWHTHVIGNITGWSVQSVTIIPHPDGDGDQVWFAVRTGAATNSVIQLLTLEKAWLATRDLEDAFYVDSGLTYDPDPPAGATTFTGLDHLEAQSVEVLADGLRRGVEVVVSGSITIDAPAVNVAQIGLAYDSILQTMRLEAGAADGTSQGKFKRITKFVVRLFQTGLGLRYGSEDDANLEDVPQAVAATAADLKDGDTVALAWPKGYEQAGRVLLKHSTPLPCTIAALMPQVVVQDR